MKPLRPFLRIMLAALTLAAAPVAAATVVTGLSPIEVLITKDAIREQLASYELYSDGDGGGATPGSRAWADNSFTPDAVFEAYDPDGKLGVRWVGREQIFRQSQAHGIDPKATVVHRHYLLSTVYDELTPTTARTRTTSIIIGATKGTAKQDPTGTMVMLLVYHDSWVKTADGWRKNYSILRRDS